MNHDFAQAVPFTADNRAPLSRLTDDAEARSDPLFRHQSLCSDAADLFVSGENQS
jgi:hypothetical protein